MRSFEIRPIAVGKIADGPVRAVCESQGNQHVVATITAGIGDAARAHFHGPCAGKKGEEIDEVTNLPENAPATLFGIVHPMVGRQMPAFTR